LVTGVRGSPGGKQPVIELGSHAHQNTRHGRDRDSTPPSTGASRRTTRLVRMGPMEFPDEGGVQNEATGNPGPLLWTVPLPVDEVLISLASAAHVQKFSDGVGWVIVDNPGGWRRNGWRAKRADRH